MLRDLQKWVEESNKKMKDSEKLQHKAERICKDASEKFWSEREAAKQETLGNDEKT